MIRLAFSSNAYLRFPFEETAGRIAAIGYEGLELLADVPHAWPAGLLPEAEAGDPRGDGAERPDVLQRQRLHDERGRRPPPAVLVSVVHRPRAALPPGPDRPHPAGPRPLRRAGRAAHHHRAGRADRRGPDRGRRRSTCSSRPSSRWPSTPTKLGVLLLIEPEPGLLLETTDQYLEVAERVDAPSIGLNFDVGHAFCVSEDLPAAIAKLAPQIRHYHVEDISADAGPPSPRARAPGRSTSPRSSRRSRRPATTAG